MSNLCVELIAKILQCCDLQTLIVFRSTCRSYREFVNITLSDFAVMNKKECKQIDVEFRTLFLDWTYIPGGEIPSPKRPEHHRLIELTTELSVIDRGVLYRKKKRLTLLNHWAFRTPHHLFYARRYLEVAPHNYDQIVHLKKSFDRLHFELLGRSWIVMRKLCIIICEMYILIFRDRALRILIDFERLINGRSPSTT